MPMSMPSYSNKALDLKPGMTRGLDFTPSTDVGQKYYQHNMKMSGDKESSNIGYAPAYMSVAHLNNPNTHRLVQREAPKFDVLQSSYKAQ